MIGVLVSSQVRLLIGCRWEWRLLLLWILLASLSGVIGRTAGFLRLNPTIGRCIVLILLKLCLLVRVLYRYYLLAIIVLECIAIDSRDLLGLHAVTLPLRSLSSAAPVTGHRGIRACHFHLLRSACCSSSLGRSNEEAGCPCLALGVALLELYLSVSAFLHGVRMLVDHATAVFVDPVGTLVQLL